MKKKIALVLCVLFLFGMVGCGAGNKNINNLSGIEFEVPSKWKQKTDSKTVQNFKTSLEKFESMNADGIEFSMPNNGVAVFTYMQLPFKADEKTQNSLIDTMKMIGIHSIIGVNNNAQNQQTDEIMIGGQKAQRTFANIKKNNEEEYFEVIVFNYGKRTYMMIFLVNKSEQEKLKNEIDNLLGSVKFTDQSADFQLPEGAKKGENIDLISGIEFGLPDDWFALLDDKTAGKVQEAVPEAKIYAARIDTPYFGNGSIIKMEMPKGSTDDFKADLGEKLISGMLTNLKNISEKKVEEISVGGKNGIRTTFNFVQAEMGFCLDLVSVTSGDDFYVFMINGEMEQKLQIQQGMNSIIESVTFK